MSEFEKKFQNIPGVKYPSQVPQTAKQINTPQTGEAESTVGPEPIEVSAIPMPAVSQNQAVEVAKPHVEVTAVSPDEMALAQSSIIDWCKNKIAELSADASEMVAAHEHAVQNGWVSAPLKRQVDKLQKRAAFYNKMLGALEAGYVIIPNFPVTAFAIRTDKTKPLKLLTTNWNKGHTQNPNALAQGEGEYQNPFPHVLERTIKPETASTSEVKEYWASAWKDLEFPLTMAKPKIMEAVDRAMALKIFDDLAIIPGFSPSEGTRPPKGDPIIVARIMDPTRSFPAYNSFHWVTFMIAWHLNTRDL